MKPFTDAQIAEAQHAYAEHGSQEKAAAALGIPRPALQRRLRAADSRGLKLKGTSTLFSIDEGGNRAPVLEWVKTTAEDIRLEETIAAIQEAFDAYAGHAYVSVLPVPVCDSDLATVYPIADLHLGMYSWFNETGADYDLNIARRMLQDAMLATIFASPASDVGVILNLGDFFHSDNSFNRTAKHGNALDVDTRYAKVLQVGVELLMDMVDLALTRHSKILVRNLPGNHDPHSAIALTLALETYYRNHDRVDVDFDPSPFWFWQWGKVLLGATHGDMAKIENMPAIMAAKVPKLWGDTEYRHVYGGHWHKSLKGGGEPWGATWEVFQTIIPKDAWNHAMGFTSGRSMTAITYHKEFGEQTRVTHNIRGPR